MSEEKKELRISILVGRVLTLLCITGAWELVSRLRLIDPIFIGEPVGIIIFLSNGLFVTHFLVPHLVLTVMGTLSAFAIGRLSGIAFGLLFVTYPSLEQLLEPILAGLNALPRIALAPLFLLWFGL